MRSAKRNPDLSLRAAQKQYEQEPTLRNFEIYRQAALRSGQPLEPTLCAETYVTLLNKNLLGGDVIAIIFDESNYSSYAPHERHLINLEMFWYGEEETAAKYGSRYYYPYDPSGYRDILWLALDLHTNRFYISPYPTKDIPGPSPTVSGYEWAIPLEKQLFAELPALLIGLGWQRAGNVNFWREAAETHLDTESNENMKRKRNPDDSLRDLEKKVHSSESDETAFHKYISALVRSGRHCDFPDCDAIPHEDATYGFETTVYCLQCRKLYCDNHAYMTMDCTRCLDNPRLCCNNSNDAYECHECSETDDTNLCQTHVNRCSVCQQTFCSTHAGRCHVCQNVVCTFQPYGHADYQDCSFSCAHCHQRTCRTIGTGCRTRCEFCHDHICTNCGNTGTCPGPSIAAVDLEMLGDPENSYDFEDPDLEPEDDDDDFNNFRRRHNPDKKESVSHGICRECFIDNVGKEPTPVKYDSPFKIVCAWCNKVIFDPKDKKTKSHKKRKGRE